MDSKITPIYKFRQMAGNGKIAQLTEYTLRIKADTTVLITALYNSVVQILESYV